jgi:hypothetical protein
MLAEAKNSQRYRHLRNALIMKLYFEEKLHIQNVAEAAGLKV